MKIFKKYALLLIIVTCALHTGAFGMDEMGEGERRAEALRESVVGGRFVEAKAIIEEAREELDGDQFKRFIFKKYDEILANPLFMVLHKSAMLVRADHKDLAAYRNCLAVAKAIIEAALHRLDSEALCEFANTCGYKGHSILWTIVELLRNIPDDKCLLGVAQSLINAVGCAIKRSGLSLDVGSKKFSQFILAENNGETVFFRTFCFYRYYLIKDNYYYNKVAKFFATVIKRAEGEAYLSSDYASALLGQFFLVSASDCTPLMSTVIRFKYSQDNGPAKELLRLAEICLPPSDFEKFIKATDRDGLTAFDLVEGNDEFRRLLNPAKAIENYKFKHEYFKKKAEIKAIKKKTEQLMGEIPGLQQECLVKKYMLNQCVGVVSETLE